MAKVIAPFLSLDASGTVAQTLTASKWKGINYMRQRVIPKNPNSFKQLAIRAVITDASLAWKNGDTVGTVVINATYKAAFNAAAEGQAYSGFDLYIKNSVAINYDTTTSPYYDGTFIAPVDPTDIGA
jgi:hypothetical protein